MKVVAKGVAYTKHCIMLTSVMLLLFGALINKGDFGGDETTYTL
jgi:hypothetical protein